MRFSALVNAVLAAWFLFQTCAAATAAAIHRSEYLSVGDARLYLQIRGANKSAPVLLWLHGGPGGAERPLFRYFNHELEKHFVVVYSDQRGAGRSFDSKADPHRLTIRQHLSDLDSVINYLKTALEKQQVVLVGHSWGAALALLYAQEHPSNVAAVVAVNPLVATRDSQQAEYDFVQRQASARDDSKTLRRLQKLGPPPYQQAGDALALDKLAEPYGAVFHTEPNRGWVMITAIFTGLVTPWEIARIIQGNEVSLQAMNQELLALDLRDTVPTLDVPVIFFLGRHDRHLDANIAATYFENLRAPAKQLVWFENSAHNIPFEEADRFDTTLVHELEALNPRRVSEEKSCR